jgi:hypothetical protein
MATVFVSDTVLTYASLGDGPWGDGFQPITSNFS